MRRAPAAFAASIAFRCRRSATSPTAAAEMIRMSVTPSNACASAAGSSKSPGRTRTPRSAQRFAFSGSRTLQAELARRHPVEQALHDERSEAFHWPR